MKPLTIYSLDKLPITINIDHIDYIKENEKGGSYIRFFNGNELLTINSRKTIHKAIYWYGLNAVGAEDAKISLREEAK